MLSLSIFGAHPSMPAAGLSGPARYRGPPLPPLPVYRPGPAVALWHIVMRLGELPTSVRLPSAKEEYLKHDERWYENNEDSESSIHGGSPVSESLDVQASQRATGNL